MTITEVLKERRYALSFEIFPPKTDAGYDSVRAAAQAIAGLSPAFISVTYGAGGGTSAYTLELASRIRQDSGVPSLAHLTCISSTKDTVRSRIRQFRDAGIENVMALRGDIPPALADADRSSWDYHHATDLIADIKALAPGLCIGGACYPEVHPESADQRQDIRFLKQKVEAGCNFLTTQMFFDNTLLYNFLYKIREAGITAPVLPGIMPITNTKMLQRAVHLSGSFVPQRFKALADVFGGDPAAMLTAGLAYATDQIIDLFANGLTHVHVYTMNRPEVAARLCENLANILGKQAEAGSNTTAYSKQQKC